VTDSLEKRYRDLLHCIAACERRYGRGAGSVRLVAVSKTKPAADIAALAALGQRQFGENYVQEAARKIAELRELALEWHFIGPIQSNKTRIIASEFDWVHTLTREKIARRLNDQRPDDRQALNVCIQINESGEATKSGVSAAQLAELAEAVAEMPRLRLRGVMALPALTADLASQREAFRHVRMLAAELARKLPDLDTMSLGTTQDLEAAIAEGATIVRVGTALFGARQ